MSPARFAVRNPVVANLLMVTIVVIGLLSFVRLPRELFTEIVMNWVFIFKAYPGVSANEIEKLITIPLEDEIQDVKGIESISSASAEGRATISIKFKDMSDEEFRARFQDLRAEVDKVQDLPEDAFDTVVMSFTAADFMPVISVQLQGAVDERRLNELARDLRQELLDIPNISKVELTGDREREIWVLADPVKLEGYAIAPEDLRLAIAAQGVNVPGGTLKSGRQEVLVRTVGEFEAAGELERVIVRTNPDGGTVRVGDVATVEEGFEEELTRSRLNRKPVISLGISKQSRGNSIAITDEVKRISEQFVSRHGGQLEVSFTQDTSEMIDQILSKLSRNAWAGFVVVLLVLFLVVGARNAVLAAMGIPLSFLACFIAMQQMGESFNGNSLFGLVLVLGIIVDDAIIIVENCYRHRQMGKSWREAAIAGTDEVMAPVLSATGTTIAAFLPAALLPGIMGKFMRIVPIAVSLALIASMIEAFFILPAHIAEWPGKKRPPQPEHGWFTALRGGYEVALRYVVARRKRFCFFGVPALMFVAVVLASQLGADLYSGEEFGSFQVRIKMPPGTNLEATSAVLEEFEDAVLALPPEELRAVRATAGFIMTDEEWVYRSDYAEIWIDLTQSYARQRTEDQIREDVRQRVERISGPISVELAKINQGPPLGKPVEVKLKGRYFDRLEAAAEALKAKLATMKGVRDIDDDFERGKQEVRFRVDPERAALYGLTVGQVGMALRNALEGATADTMYDGDEEIDIVVKVTDQAFERPADLLDLPLLNPGGATVALGSVASFTVEPSLSDIRRYKQERAITVFGDIDETVTSSVQVNQAIGAYWEEIAARHPGVTLDFSGEFEEFKGAFTGLIQLLAVGILLMYGILATQFRSYTQPLVILGTVPLAFCGAIFGLFISGNPFSIATGFGMMALAGIAVNDAIVLVSFVNNRRRDGVDTFEAVIEAGKLRLRPIILTSVTTMAGLLPMAMGLGGASLTWSPLANTIVWGIGVATFMTIFMIPALYAFWVGDVVERLLGRRINPTEVAEEA